MVAHGRRNGTIAPSFLVMRCPQAAPGNFEVKRFGAFEHSNDSMAVSSDDYSTSNFMGSAHTAVLFSPPRDGFSILDDRPRSSYWPLSLSDGPKESAPRHSEGVKRGGDLAILSHEDTKAKDKTRRSLWEP